MVDIADLSQVQAYYAEANSIRAALEIFDQGGRITFFGVGGIETAAGPTSSVQVDASYMEYPPQMVDMIRTLMHDRLDAIDSALAGLGVTGVEPTPR